MYLNAAASNMFYISICDTAYDLAVRTWKHNGIQIVRLCLYDKWSYVLKNVRNEYSYPFCVGKVLPAQVVNW